MFHGNVSDDIAKGLLALRRTIVGDAATAIFVAFIYHLESTGLAPSGSDSF